MTATTTDNWQLGLAVFDVVREDVKGLTLPKGEAAAKIIDAAGRVSEAAKQVAHTADHISNEARKEGKK